MEICLHGPCRGTGLRYLEHAALAPFAGSSADGLGQTMNPKLPRVIDSPGGTDQGILAREGCDVHVDDKSGR